MIYTILISVVFIAELIITITILQNLIKLDKAILNLDSSIEVTKSGVKDICVLFRKISEQWVILAQNFVDKTKRDAEDAMLKQVSKALVSLLVVSLNFKFIRKVRNFRITKTLAKGWSIVENMV